MKVKWVIEVDGEVHLLELEHGDYSGRKTITMVRGAARSHFLSPGCLRSRPVLPRHTRCGCPQDAVQVHDSGMTMFDRGLEHKLYINSHE